MESWVLLSIRKGLKFFPLQVEKKAMNYLTPVLISSKHFDPDEKHLEEVYAKRQQKMSILNRFYHEKRIIPETQKKMDWCDVVAGKDHSFFVMTKTVIYLYI